MKTRNSTKSKLLSSVIALVLCVSMLIGATFAWFTDTASTAVNKIQAGTLDVALEMKNAEGNWVNAEGQTLQFKKAAGATEGEQVLWEPGCTYELPELRIVNNGDLALKYKIQITGIDGSAKLNEAIDWTMNDAAINSAAEYYLAPKDKSMTIRGNNVTDTSASIVIKGTMQTSAGNEYQGLTIDGIGITVFATQVDAESDSFGNTYDQNAGYIERHATIMGDDGKTITLEQGKTYTVGNGKVEVDANGNITYTNAGAPQTVTIQTDGGTLTVNAPNDTVNHYGESDNVVITAVAAHSYHEFGKVAVLSIAQGRVVVENGDNIGVIQVKPSDAATTNPVVIAVPENVVLDTKIERTNATTAFKLDVLNSNGTAIEEKSQEVNSAAIPPAPSGELEKVLGTGGIANGVKNYVASNGKTYYDSLQKAVDAGGTVKLVNHVSLISTLKVSNDVTINMNGYNIAGKDVRAIQVKQGTLKLDGTGTVSSNVANVGSSVIRVGDNDATSSATLSVKKGVTVSTGTAYGITAFGNKYEYVYVHGKVTSTAPENAAYDGCAISTVGDDTTKSSIYVYDGATVSAANTNAIYMPSGTLYVYDGATVTGRTGIYVKSGSTTIKGGTITGNGPAKGYDYYGNGGISTGDALVVDSCGYPSGKPSVTVSGGTFTSANAKAVASYNTKGNALVTGFVNGGTFSSNPSDYVPFGYKAANAGNTWSVSKVNSTAEEPMHITNEADWLSLASQASSSSATAGQYYVVDKDLDFTGVTQKAGLKFFAGNIDFQGHTISGLNGSNTHTYRYPSLFKIVKADATIKNLKFELPNLGTDYTVKPIGSIYGTGTVTLENIAISGNLNMADNNTGLLVDFIGGYSKFVGTVNLIGCTSTCNMVNNGYSSVFIGGIYYGGNQIVLNAKDCVNYGNIISTDKAASASMLISNPTRYKGDSLTLNIENCRNEGQIIAAPGKTSYLAMPDAGSELRFYTAEEIKAFETNGDIVNANGGNTASLDPGKLAVVGGEFDLAAAMEKVPKATRFELVFGFQGTGGLGGGGVTQYTFSFDSREAVKNVPAHSWVNASKATGELTAHNEYGTTYYTDEAGHYVFNLAGYLMNNQPEVSFIAYDAAGNVMLVDFYSYAN